MTSYHYKTYDLYHLNDLSPMTYYATTTTMPPLPMTYYATAALQPTAVSGRSVDGSHVHSIATHTHTRTHAHFPLPCTGAQQPPHSAQQPGSAPHHTLQPHCTPPPTPAPYPHTSPCAPACPTRSAQPYTYSSTHSLVRAALRCAATHRTLSCPQCCIQLQTSCRATTNKCRNSTFCRGDDITMSQGIEIIWCTIHKTRDAGTQ